VSDEGRTVHLGTYSFRGSPRQYAKLPPLEGGQPQAKRDLPAGTYHLLAGRYQRVLVPVSSTPVPASAPATGHRAAVGAAEVNGTFRDAQGQDLAILACRTYRTPARLPLRNEQRGGTKVPVDRKSCCWDQAAAWWTQQQGRS
jgi:hypothetical protein